MTPREEIQLITGSASTALRNVLQQVGARYPEVQVELGSAARFKRHFGALLAEFEARRALSPNHAAIAAFSAEVAQAQFQFAKMALPRAVREPATPLPLEVQEGSQRASAPTAIAYRERRYEREHWGELAEELFARGLLCPVARAALQRQAQRPQAWNLQGQRFVLLGAGAELAPTPLLLNAGAEMLWLDLRPPPLKLREQTRARLWWCRDGADLLREPARIRQTIETFAAGGPCHMGLYAYAPGGAREWRLTAAMNSIVEAIDPQLVASASLLLSPASPTPISPVDWQRATQRLEHDPWWVRRCPWRRPPHGDPSAARVFHGVVPLQGTSYQAAQYVGKRLAAASFRQLRPQWHVSSNVAGISRTRSLEHPVFGLAFDGAHELGVEIFDPAFTRLVNGLLTLEDLFGGAEASSDTPSPETAPSSVPTEAQLHREAQLHGGVMNLPVALETAIGLAAMRTALHHPLRAVRALRQS